MHGSIILAFTMALEWSLHAGFLLLLLLSGLVFRIFSFPDRNITARRASRARSFLFFLLFFFCWISSHRRALTGFQSGISVQQQHLLTTITNMNLWEV